MRGNLIRQLNHWDIHRYLRLENASELFGRSRHLVHTTSLLRYPVFVRGGDYRGTPDMTKHHVLREYLLKYFVDEVEQMKDALFFSLGSLVQKVLDKLVVEGAISSDRLIGGLLHPSGNNTYRVNYLTGDRTSVVPHATNPRPYDLGRKLFHEKFLLI